MKPLIPYFDATNLDVFGILSVKTPGLFVIIGLISGVYLAAKKARRDGLDTAIIYRLVKWIIVGIFVGGHLGHLLFYYPQQLISDPLSLFNILDGQSSFGGFIMCGFLVIWFFRREIRKRKVTGLSDACPINIWAYADCMIYGFTLGWFFGRMGCFAVHDHPGIETSFWLGVYGICPSKASDIACHDLGFYEGIISLCFFFLFVFLDRKPRFQGFFTGVWAFCYGMSRFMLDILRYPDIDARYFGFTPAQHGSVVLIFIGMWIFMTRRRSQPVQYTHAKSIASHQN